MLNRTEISLPPNRMKMKMIHQNLFSFDHFQLKIELNPVWTRKFFSPFDLLQTKTSRPQTIFVLSAIFFFLFVSFTFDWSSKVLYTQKAHLLCLFTPFRRRTIEHFRDTSSIPLMIKSLKESLRRPKLSDARPRNCFQSTSCSDLSNAESRYSMNSLE